MIRDGRWYEERLILPEADGPPPLAGLSLILADAAGAHAEQLGFGIDELRARNLTWMLSRFHIRVNRYPMAGERVTVATWPSGIVRRLALRDFRLTASDDTEIAAAISGWFLVDLCKKRPVQPEAHLARFCLAERAFDSALDRIEGDDPVASRATFAARAGDIDANHHVTFTSYIAWIEKAMDGAEVRRGSVRDLEINYLAEVFDGETIRVDVGGEARAGGRRLVTVVREADQSAVARAVVV